MNVIYEIGFIVFDGLFFFKKLDIFDNMLKNLFILLFFLFWLLEELDLSVNNFIKIWLGFFRGLESLKVLNFLWNDFEFLEDCVFEGFGKLIVLDLRYNFLVIF